MNTVSHKLQVIGGFLAELRFVTGKGGVGKSLYSMALAQASARKGKKTLLVELGEQSFFRWVLPFIPSFKPLELSKNLSVARWDGPDCLREYGTFLIKSERLVNLFMENRVSKTLIRVAPGLFELALLGKATSGPPRNIGPKFDYDRVIVDCFSTGHFLALMKAPLGFSRAFGVGPMGDQSRAIVLSLRDPKISEFHFVSVPEALSVIELSELVFDFEKLEYGSPRIIANKNFENLDLNSENVFEKNYLKKETQNSKNFLAEMTALNSVKAPIVKIPFFFENQFLKIATLASEHLVDLA